MGTLWNIYSSFYTCLSFCPQGGSASVHAGIPPPEQKPPREQTPPPGADTPWEQTPPQEQTPPHRPGISLDPGADPPRADIPPGVDPPEMATVADGTHPSGMYSCLRFIYKEFKRTRSNNVFLLKFWTELDRKH